MIRALFPLHYNDVSNESRTGERLDIGDRAARFLAPQLRHVGRNPAFAEQLGS